MNGRVVRWKIQRPGFPGVSWLFPAGGDFEAPEVNPARMEWDDDSPMLWDDDSEMEWDAA